MGSKTLVDVVSAIWGLASATISAVKNVASDPLGAIKAGLEFVADIVYIAILESLKFIFKNFIQAVGSIVSVLHQNVNVQNTNNGITIDNKIISVTREGKSISIILDNITIRISNLFNGLKTSYDTLSVSSNELILASASLQLLGSIIILGIQPSFSILSIIGSAVVLATLINQVLLTSKIDSSNRNDMKSYYLGSMISILIPLLFKFTHMGIIESSVPKAEFSFIARFTKVYPTVANTYTTIQGMIELIEAFAEGEIPSSYFFMGFSVSALDYLVGLINPDKLTQVFQFLYDILLFVTFATCLLTI